MIFLSPTTRDQCCATKPLDTSFYPFRGVQIVVSDTVTQPFNWQGLCKMHRNATAAICAVTFQAITDYLNHIQELCASDQMIFVSEALLMGIINAIGKQEDFQLCSPMYARYACCKQLSWR